MSSVVMREEAEETCPNATCRDETKAVGIPHASHLLEGFRKHWHGGQRAVSEWHTGRSR